MAEPREALPPDLFPLLAGALPGAGLARAGCIGEGWGSVAYRVPAPGGDWALRVRREESFRAVGSDFEREVRLLPLLEAAGLSVGREARAIRDERGDVVAAAHRLVEGETATRGRLGRGRRRERLAAQLGDFFTRLHAFPRERALASGVPGLDLWRDRYRPMFEECRGLLGPRSRQWLDDTAARFVAEGGMTGAPRLLVHGDVSTEHIRLRDDGSLSGVIDFGDAMVADPALDAGGLLLAYGPPFTEQVLAHYGGEVDPHFRRRARFYVDVVPIFLVRFGHLFHGGRDRIEGLRQFAARASAAARKERR